MLTRRLALVTLALGLVLLVGACGGDDDFEDRIAALKAADPGRLVIAKHLDDLGGGFMASGSFADEFLKNCPQQDDCSLPNLAPTLTVTIDGSILEIHVGAPCYLAVHVGDPWPHPAEECR